MTIIIAGGGIGGLTAALSLHAAGSTELQVVESSSLATSIGVGINLPPHAVRELDELGLGAPLADLGVETAELVYYDPQGTRLWAEPRGTSAGYAWPQYSVHRGALQRLLLEAVHQRLGRECVVLGSRVTHWSARPDGCVDVHTTGVGAAGSRVGESEIGDAKSGDAESGEAEVREPGTPGAPRIARLLIGADGIRSAVRRVMYPDESLLPWNGWVMFRGAARIALFLTGQSMVIIGDENQRVVAYPISKPDPATGTVMVNWILTRRSASLPEGGDASLGDWNAPIDPATLTRFVTQWRYDWLDVPAMIGATSAAFEYPMVDVEPLPRWTFGSATLLGDAAHAMYPFGSNGASQAILDARILAWHLATQPSDAAALNAYEQARRPATREVQLANRRQAAEVMKRVSELARQQALAQAAGELLNAEAEYKRLAGFDPATLNARPSIP